ncbi:MAG: hypothetical protein H0U76_22200 [Ktedonobacteraceae bacterium]|nr:hypothetical protein [Ktedonobacteraceae bacterium]
MPDFFFKRIVHIAQYYRISAENEERAHLQINERLDHLADGLTMFQDESFPTEREVSLPGNEHIELLDALPLDDEHASFSRHKSA